MAVANVIRVSLLGNMPNGESWTVNPVWQIGGVSTAEDISNEEAQTIATAIAAIALPTGLAQQWSTSTSWAGARVEARRWDGTLAAQAEALKAIVAPGTSSGTHPFQTALVSSLRSATPGGSGRGRLYWPATGVPLVTNTLRPAFATITTALSAVKTLLTSIGAAIDVTTTNSPVLSVWSRTNASTAPVTSINMGDVCDVQRRRRDALLENYQALAFP
jgi:hypothetical protein